MREVAKREFANGVVYALETDDGYPIEVTDTFLPLYTKYAVNEHSNQLKSAEYGDRSQRWMVGVSCMSGCPVGCKFCATGQLKKCRNLTAMEIIDQVEFVLARNPEYNPAAAQEFKVNYTRMGEPMLNLEQVRLAIKTLDLAWDDYHGGPKRKIHHYISTIGIQGMDTSWIGGNVTLQVSLHSCDEARRDDLIPYKRKMSIEQLGQIRTQSDLKTTLNMTLVDEADFDIEILKRYFDPAHFFVKLSPINVNCVSEANAMGNGVIEATNLI